MASYQFIKSREKMQAELFALWDERDLYKFTFGEDGIKATERDICECLVDWEMFIITCRLRYFLKQKT